MGRTILRNTLHSSPALSCLALNDGLTATTTTAAVAKRPGGNRSDIDGGVGGVNR